MEALLQHGSGMSNLQLTMWPYVVEGSYEYGLTHVTLCGDLNENDSHRLIYMYAWSPVGGASWEGLGDMALLEEVCLKGWASGF